MKKILILLIALLAIPSIVLAASTSYYAKSTVYFLVPSDASFSVALPADYTSFTAITGTNEGGATALSYISFNYTNVPQAGLQQPYQLGDNTKAQNTTSNKPIFYIDNTGNVPEQFKVYIDSSTPTGVYIYVNASCGTCTAPLTVLTAVAVSASTNTLTTSLANTDYLNITLFSNTSSGAVAGETSRTFYIYSTAV